MKSIIRHKSLSYVLLTSIGVAAAGCQKLEGPTPPELMKGIPAAYGEFVNVTDDANVPHTAVLWFEQPDKTIVAVRVNFRHGQIVAQSVKFARN